MSESPIYNIVHNNCSIDKTYTWAKSDTIYVVAGGDVKVPYDIWSRADGGQRVSMLASMAEGSVSITVGVYDGDKYIEVPLKPAEVKDIQKKENTASDAFVPEVKPATIMQGLTEEDKAFNVVAKTSTTDFNKEYYAVKADGPAVPVEKMEGDSSEHGDEIKSEPVEAAVQDASSTPEERFNKLCDAKRWSEALAVLKEVYGDKVTFGARALIQLKTWQAVIDKYNLEA